MMRARERRFDWFMALIVVPVALLGAFVLYIGAKDEEERREQLEVEHSYDVDSIRQVHKALYNLEDSIHEYEDGF